MRYFSTNDRLVTADFRQATIDGQPAGRGLYFPEAIPRLPGTFIQNIREYSKEAIGYEVMKPYVGNVIDKTTLKTIIEETVNFDFPLIPLSEQISVLELFHGPTLAFKDVGARFLSRCLGYFARDEKRKLTVLVATSGDTGGAVADAFNDLENVQVVILYPSGKVSDIQERQVTTLGNNITALEVEGSFDDCQRLVKDAFSDGELKTHMFLTSANSINIARWLPQQLYYFYAYRQWTHDRPPLISIPCGNFGNLCAGLLAYRSGLPVQHFIAACNENDVVPIYLASGVFEPKAPVHTLSNAMDIGNPSNFARMLTLFDLDHRSLQKILSGYRVSDAETIDVIHEVRRSLNYLLDPHGAVAFEALKRHLKLDQEQKGIVLETAHPVKFDATSHLLSERETPSFLNGILAKEKRSTRLPPVFKALKEFLMTMGQ